MCSKYHVCMYVSYNRRYDVNFLESLDYDLSEVQSRHFGNLSILYSIYTEHRDDKKGQHTKIMYE